MENMKNTENAAEKKSFGQNLKKFLASTAGRVAMTVLLYFGFFAIFAVIPMDSFDSLGVIWAVLAIVFFYFGWKALNRITPKMFLVMSIQKWIVYYLFKGFLALIIGVFVAPFVIAKMISKKISQTIGDTL